MRKMIILTCVLLFIIGCQTDQPPNGTENTEPGGNVVEMRNIQFVPETLDIGVGETVIWRNEDDVLHTVTGFGVDKNVPSGETFEHTFTEPGTYDYTCTIHPEMSGQIVVR